MLTLLLMSTAYTSCTHTHTPCAFATYICVVWHRIALSTSQIYFIYYYFIKNTIITFALSLHRMLSHTEAMAYAYRTYTVRLFCFDSFNCRCHPQQLYLVLCTAPKKKKKRVKAVNRKGLSCHKNCVPIGFNLKSVIIVNFYAKKNRFTIFISL